MIKIIMRLLPLLSLFFFQPTFAEAQQGNRPLSLNLGDAVVTGFSGTLPPQPGKPLPRNKSAVDVTFINPDGPAVRIIDVSRPGYVWDGRLFAAPKTFDVFAKDVGQVFGIALDDAAQPNIYVAATSVFGLNLVSRGRDGLPERKRKGAPGAGWMKGQFGLDLQGGPGAIYKIDGRTGTPTLFANVTLNGVPNPGPGLGNLAYDSAHKQLFVSDLYTGMIHRFDLDGKELGAYDHGVTGLGAAKLATVPFNARNRPNIASDRFDTEKPDSWGFAPAARRVWGLAVHEGRLYYSVVSGPQIWSVGIERDGSFAADPHWELDVPAQAGPLPVSDIAFSQQGAMLLAQRALIAGAYDYLAFTRPGEPQVLRFWLKAPNDPPSPGRWKLVPEEYAVGFAGNLRNTNGSVALGYGYGQDGMLAPQACDAALWTTGQSLRNNPALRSQLEPGGPLVVHGLQGSPADLVRRGNDAPSISYFVDYDDNFREPRASGHIGSVRIYTTPCAAPAASAAPVPAVIPIVTPIGCVGPNCRNACTPTCVCPNGGVLKDGKCVEACPPPMVLNPQTGVCGCPPGTVLRGKECVRIVTIAPPHECRPPLVLDPITGLCVPPKHECRPPLVLDPITGLCVPPKHECVPPLVLDPVTHTCVCPQGTVLQDGKCVPQICPASLVPGPCTCPEGTVQDGGLCVSSIDLQIGKENTPAGGSGTWFNVWVTNAGPPITFPAGAITITENIPAGMTVTGITGTGWSCAPPTIVGPGPMTCTYNLAGSLATNASLPSTMFVHYTTTGPGPFTNCATVGIGTSVGVDTNPANDTACATVTGTPIDVGIGKTGAPTPYCPAPYYGWTITVTNGPNAWPGTGNITVTDTVPANMTFDPIVSPPWACLPLGAHAAGTTFTCTYNGPALTANQVLPPINITATATIGPPFPPYVNCASVAIASSSGYVDSNPANNNVCTSPVLKPAACTCTPPQVMNADGICACPNGQVLVGGACVPTPPVCPPPQVPNVDGICACPAPMQPGAVPGQCICPQGQVLVGGACVPTPPICPPPQVPNVDGICACPAPMLPGAILGQCICPQGQVLVGGACVPTPPICPPPQVPNVDGICACPAPMLPGAVPGQCICPRGTVLTNGKCVTPPPPVRKQPVKKKRAEPDCPRGTTNQHGKCVKRQSKEPGITTRDVIDGIGIINGIRGGGGGGGNKGGGTSPGAGGYKR